MFDMGAWDHIILDEAVTFYFRQECSNCYLKISYFLNNLTTLDYSYQILYSFLRGSTNAIGSSSLSMPQGVASIKHSNRSNNTYGV